jgi:2-polyprenyl-6-methoxyphenol hydroxylase-like FAD-dependent oxidoreductase
MKVTVVGGSAAGQLTSLLLAKAGHQVVILDSDPLPVAPDVEAAATRAFRQAAPQLVQPHALLPRCRLLLREHVPDVFDQLLAAGAVESPLARNAPPNLVVDEQSGDDDYTSLATRRSTLDWVLRKAVCAQPAITLHDGARVRGLLTDGGSPPRVTGVSTDDGDIHSALVVDATGRRTRVDSWLTTVGARPTSLVEAECGLAYHSRHYRLRPGATPPGHPATRILLGLDEFTTGLWGSDNGTALIAVAPLVEDRRFRAAGDPDVFTSVLRCIPSFAPWLDAMEPTTRVFSMGGLHNTLRRVVVDGEPVATGLAVVGDSMCTTNPTFGRGIPLAIIGARDLVAAIDEFGDDLVRLAGSLDRRVTANVEPFFVDQAHNDRARLAALRHTIFGTPAPSPDPRPDAVSFGELRAVMSVDATLLRAFWRVMGMLSHPENVYTDPDVVRRTHAALRDGAPLAPIQQPSRAEIDTALAMAASRV